MRRVLVKAGYASTPLIMFGTIALMTGPGRRRVAILALAVVIAVILAAAAGGTVPRSTDREQPTPLAAQPADVPAIVKRLKVGLEPLAGYENHDGILVSNGSDVVPALRNLELEEWRNGCAAVRFGAPRRRRQSDAVEGLLGHGWHDRAGAPDLAGGSRGG